MAPVDVVSHKAWLSLPAHAKEDFSCIPILASLQGPHRMKRSQTTFLQPTYPLLRLSFTKMDTFRRLLQKTSIASQFGPKFHERLHYHESGISPPCLSSRSLSRGNPFDLHKLAKSALLRGYELTFPAAESDYARLRLDWSVRKSTSILMFENGLGFEQE